MIIRYNLQAINIRSSHKNNLVATIRFKSRETSSPGKPSRLVSLRRQNVFKIPQEALDF